MVRPNKVKEALKAGRKTYGFHLTFPAPPVIEILGTLPFDFVYLDGEHGPFDPADLEDLCRAAELADLTMIARIPDLLPGTVNRFLDRGVQGIIGPHVSTAEEAEGLVRACYFAPSGERSWGDARCENYGLGIADPQSFRQEINDTISVSVMIEDATGVENVEAIASVAGVDYITFGMQDLAQGLGFPGELNHPEVKKMVTDMVERIHGCGAVVREDFMVFAWVRDILIRGATPLIEDR